MRPPRPRLPRAGSPLPPAAGLAHGRAALVLVRRTGAAGLAVLSLLLGALLVAVVPIAGTACPAATSSLLAADVPPPRGESPTLEDTVVAEYDTAISSARSAIDEHSSAVQEASATLAETRRKAEAAKAAAEASAPGWELESAVEEAQRRLDSAKSSLAFDQDELDTYADDEYLGDFYRDSVADDEKEVASAEKALAPVKAKLAAARAKAKTADAAAAKAKAARTRAESTHAEAQSASDALQTDLDNAIAQRDAGNAAHAAEVAVWTHEQRVAADAVAAENAVLASCRATGVTTLAVSAALTLVALLLAGWNIVAARREP
jgi:hypothetical protein